MICPLADFSSSLRARPPFRCFGLVTELPEKVACYWGAEYFAATKGPFPLPSHTSSWVASCTTQNRSRPRERSQPAIPTRTFGAPQDLRSRRPFRDSQLIPTFCSAERQHTSSGPARKSSYFPRGQYYDDCRCSTLEGASCRVLMRPAWLCDARARHCAQSRPLQL